MDKKKGVTFVDTNVFIIDLRYRNDRNFGKNQAFLDFIASSGKGMTSIYNLLEVCGILSFNLSPKQILELFYYLPARYNVEVIPSHTMESMLPTTSVRGVMDVIHKKASFGDALIAHFVKENVPESAIFVSWDAIHFKNLLPIKTLTPEEFFSQESKRDSNPSVTKDKQFVAYVTQGFSPEKSALKG